MKSKPPTKKSKLEASSPLTPTPGHSSEGKPRAKILSSIKQEATSKAATATTASELLAATKIKHTTVGNVGNITIGGGTTTRLSFPILQTTELSKDFPRITHITQHSARDGGETASTQHALIPMDEVDLLQNELETMWSALSVRTRIVENENEILESLLGGLLGVSSIAMSAQLGEHYDPHHQEKINAVKSIIDSGHGTRTSVSAAAKLVLGAADQVKGGTTSSSSSSTSIVVGSSRKSNNSAAAATSVSIPSPSPSGRQPKKKLKVDLGDKSKVGGYKPARAGQNRSHSVSMDDSFLRHEAPNQFWEFADSYCRDLTQDDIDELEKEIADFRLIPDSVFSIPPLGKHFSGIEKKGTADIVHGVSSIRVRDEKDIKAAKDIVGPLTQRLVTALVEDRVSQYAVQPNNGTREDMNGSGAGGGDFHLIPRPGLVKALGLDVTGPGAQIPLEARLKMVLAEQGYLLGDEAEDPFNDNQQQDEVLAEIKRTFNTLKKLHNYNVDKLDKLRDSSNKELSRLSHKKELEKADKEIIAAYRSIAACRMKRKPITQKERSIATKALQLRQQAIEKLSAQGNSDDPS